MEPDGFLCSRTARPQKDGEGAARCPSCSQNAHGETVLVRRAHHGTDPGRLERLFMVGNDPFPCAAFRVFE